jgi:exopolysaccharide biosynthesis polyprenyl glycosylphosphotransferase
MANGLARELRELTPPAPAPVALPERDARARRPLILSTILRLDTMRRGLRVLTLLWLDVTGLFLAVWTALAIKAAIRDPSQLDLVRAQAEDVAPLATLVMVLLFARSGLYRDRPLRPGSAKVISSLVQTTVVVWLYAEIEGIEFSSYYVFYGSLFFALIYVSTLRWLFEKASGVLLRAAGYRRRTVLVGGGSHIEDVAEALSNSHAIEPFGYVSLTPHRSARLRDFGTLDSLEKNFDSVDEVLIADPQFPQDEAVELVDRCHEHGVKVRVAPSTMEILMDRIEFVPGQSLPLFELKPPVFEGLDFVVKRSFDIVGAALLLILLSPVLTLIAFAVRTSSRGPVLYRSMRPGIGGKPFACLKFRTMSEGAEHLQDELERRNEMGGALFKIRDDPRVTRVGAFLRRWSFDELPQLFNVLRGEMSLVGPRPLPMRDYERLEDWHRKRNLVLPGMTGLWQVSGRSELDFDDLVRLDFLYLERWSVFLDLSILLKTGPAVLRARGAW